MSDTGGHALNQYELLQESGKAVGLLPREKHETLPTPTPTRGWDWAPCEGPRSRNGSLLPLPDLRESLPALLSPHWDSKGPGNSPSSRCAHMTLDNNTPAAPPLSHPRPQQPPGSIQRTQLPLPWPESARASTSVVCVVSFNRSGCKARAQETGASSHFLSTRARALDSWLRALHNLRSRRGVAGLRAGLGSLPDLASDPNSAVGPLCDLELVTSLL